MELYDQAQEAANFIREQINLSTKSGLVLGTGLGSIIDKEITSLSYAEIPHFPQSTVEGHSGRLILASIGGKEVLVLSGRFHYYEGYSLAEVSFPIRVLKALGIEQLIITNVTGGLNADYQAGDVVFVRDHINLLPDNPLRGLSDPRLGNRFPDMLSAYDKGLLQRAQSACEKLEITYRSGVYVCLQGPSLETPAEYQWLHNMGADMVGMSTVPEVIVARQCEIKTIVMSCISNVCYPIDALTETTIESVIEIAKQSSKSMGAVIDVLLSD